MLTDEEAREDGVAIGGTWCRRPGEELARVKALPDGRRRSAVTVRGIEPRRIPVRLSFELATDADPEQLATLRKLTERYRPARRVHAWHGSKINDEYSNYCVNQGKEVRMHKRQPVLRAAVGHASPRPGHKRLTRRAVGSEAVSP